MKQKSNSVGSSNTASASDEKQISMLLNNFEETELLIEDTNINILDYWSQRGKDDMLGKLARVVLVAPGTQVSVERLFSILKWILSEKRNQIDENVLEDTLLIIAQHHSDKSI